MKRRAQRRWMTTPLVAILAVVTGLSAGVLVGRFEATRQMRVRMEQFASRTLAETDISSAEAHTVLTAANASHLPFCSNADIDSLRRLVFESEFLKDVGRIRDGKIVCSSMAWKLDTPEPMPQPSFVTTDGLNAYMRMTPPDGGSRGAFAESQGEVYIVFSPFIEAHRASPPIRYLSSAMNSRHGQPGDPNWPELGGEAVSTDSMGVRGRILYATRCSQRYGNCVTGWMPVQEAIATNRRLIAAYTALGGLAGLLLVIFFAILSARGWEMQRQLRKAVRRGEIELLYQPIVDLKTRSIIGAEALARWTDRTGKLVSPEIFIPLAVRCGVIGELTRLVVWRALHDLGALLRGPESFQLSINVTAEDLTGQPFVDMLKAATYAATVDPGRIAIEITESSTARGAEAEATIQDLQAAGYSVHIDDFGTGYSSLSYLQDLAVDAIKIDRSFTRAVGTGAANAAVLPRILAMAEALNLEVVVEGIETEDQAAYFASTGQPLQGQGWLFGRPMQAADLAARLRDQCQDAEQPAAQSVV